jgi:type IV secretion system protein TrbL
VVLISVVVVWVAMMIRKLLIVVAAIFAPLAFAGGTSQLTAGWVRHWIEMMVALIVSKLILIIMFIIGYGVLFASLGEPANSTGAQKITNVAVGALILAMSGLSPWLAIKMVHFAGGHFDQIHHQANSVSAAPRQAMEVPQKLALASRGLPGSNGRNGFDGQSGPAGREGLQGPPGKQAETTGSAAGAGGSAGAASSGAGAAAAGSAAAAPVVVAVAATTAARSAAGKVSDVGQQAGEGK